MSHTQKTIVGAIALVQFFLGGAVFQSEPFSTTPMIESVGKKWRLKNTKIII